MTEYPRSDPGGTSAVERGIGNETDAMSPLADHPGSAPTWVALLAGPVLWIAHFVVVYVGSEITCRGDGTEWGGTPAATVITLTATAAAVIAIGIAALLTERERRRPAAGDNRLLAVGLALDALFAASVLAVGVPALVLDPC
jgi:hypothetical protein